MILEILKYPNGVLRKKSEEIKEITPDIKELAFIMIETMGREKGVGLAAPQVGISKRIIAVTLEEGKGAILINPAIVKKGKEKCAEEEGCLSFPKLFLKIKRAEEIEVEALDVEGKTIKFEAKDLAARIIQHEIDHLDGILIIDRIGFWRKLKIRKKY